MQWEKLVQLAQEVIDETIGGLPEAVKSHATGLPLSFEEAPSHEVQEEGIEEDTLGLFVGESLENVGATLSPMPAQILLFLRNIWDFAERDPDLYREEVRITFLHELGHYFGWDEEDLFHRDLD